MSAGAFGQIAATGMNIFNAAQDRRFVRSEARGADARQLEGSKHLTMFNKAQQLDMWRKTGVTGQMEEMRKAGLNPALMYESGGTGGQTALTSGSGQGTKADNAPSYKVSPAEVAQIALMDAQKKNIEADTDNKRADLPVKGETARATQIENDRLQYASKEDGKSGLDIRREQEIANIDWTQGSLRRMQQDVNIAKEALEIDWKNAKTNEERNRIYEDVERQKRELELELFDRGMNQRQIEFTVNKVFEGVDKVIQFRSGGLPTTTRTYQDDSDGNWSQRSTTTKRGR